MKSILLAGAALLLAAAPASATVPATDASPAGLARGADVAIPHVEGHDVVDGDTRIPVAGGRLELLGTSGSAYVVHVSPEDGTGPSRTYRVEADGTRTLLTRGSSDQLRLSDDGDHLLRADLGSRRRTEIRVLDARTGAEVASRTFRGDVFPLDASAGRAILSSWGPARTLSWNYLTDRTRQVVARTGGTADISADRLGSYTGDPYDGGCYLVTSLSHPADVLWRTCGERAVAFSPDGRRVATVGILSDGLGPSMVAVHRVKGRTLARYTARWFGEVRWESATALLLDSNGKRKSATVRCVLDECERASDLAPAPQY